MAKAEKADNTKTEEALVEIETHAANEKTPAYILAGVMAAQNWAAGKAVTLSEYSKAVASFLKGPMKGA